MYGKRKGKQMPNARTSDPLTSHEAAESVANITETQEAIYKLLRHPLTDEQLIDGYKDLVMLGLAPKASESGIRSRRAELVQLSLIEAKGDSKTWSGRRCIVWGRV
jgi:hypothetical protein